MTSFRNTSQAILASAVLCALFARGGIACPLGFVMLWPWLRSLDQQRGLLGSLLSGWAMSVTFTVAVFAWFGSAIGLYTQVGAGTGLVLLLLLAPIFQPQFLSFVLVRYLATRRYGKVVGALAAASAWLATEWCVPKLLGDSLGHGLYPSELLRQGADIGGVAGLTLLLLLTNECLTHAWSQRKEAKRAILLPLAFAASMPLLLAGYGAVVLSNPILPTEKPLRMGLIQSNIVDYERQRQQFGALATVRKLLDTHFAMSYDAVVRQHADAVMWSETSYPTTFGKPKSAAGDELDQAILSIVKSAGVPFVIGTYDRDDAGEYNAAAFVGPDTGLLGFYRKTRLFPLTEYVPAWLDGPTLRRWLPWTGNWRHGNGARVFPLRLADGREIPVLPLICRDDVDSSLGIAGARQGAQVILTMSNDAWFTAYPQGAELHQAVAAFRSIETRLPQFRVTSNGFSGLIDATGKVLAPGKMGEQTLVIGELVVRTPPLTLIVKWGDWLGVVALSFLALLLVLSIVKEMMATPLWQRYQTKQAAKRAAQPANLFPLKLSVLPPAARIIAGVLRSFARVSLLGLGFAMLYSDALRGNTFAQIRAFSALFLAPELAASCVLLAFAARASIANGKLVLEQGTRRIELALAEILTVETWRMPLPCSGVTLCFSDGANWHFGLAQTQVSALMHALGRAPTRILDTRGACYTQARLAIPRGKLDLTLVKYVLLPLLLAFPAYFLHQHIAYGSGFGEFTSFGWQAYAKGLAIWWAAWCIGVMVFAAALRALIEMATLLAVLLKPKSAGQMRRWFEITAKLALYLGVPGWLVLRVVGS